MPFPFRCHFRINTESKSGKISSCHIPELRTAPRSFSVTPEEEEEDDGGEPQPPLRRFLAAFFKRGSRSGGSFNAPIRERNAGREETGLFMGSR